MSLKKIVNDKRQKVKRKDSQNELNRFSKRLILSKEVQERKK